jgi:beta-N-acetylhexosaminidase
MSIANAETNITIIQKPIDFSEHRVELTREYIKYHYGLSVKDIKIEPKIIVLHYTAVKDLNSSFAYFKPEEIGNMRPDIVSAGKLNTSAQFLVDKDGSIYQLMPDNWMARHAIGLNYFSIGVENVGCVNGVDDLTDAQIEANIKLVKYLKEKYPDIEYLIGHYQYRQFEGTNNWLEKNKKYRTEKSDPGRRFMKRVLDGVKELGLKTLKL